MRWENRYYRHSRVAGKTFRSLIRYFPLDIGASIAAKPLGWSIRAIPDILEPTTQKTNLPVGQASRITGIASFWAFAKLRWAKFKGYICPYLLSAPERGRVSLQLQTR